MFRNPLVPTLLCGLLVVSIQQNGLSQDGVLGRASIVIDPAPSSPVAVGAARPEPARIRIQPTRNRARFVEPPQASRSIERGAIPVSGPQQTIAQVHYQEPVHPPLSPPATPGGPLPPQLPDELVNPFDPDGQEPGSTGMLSGPPEVGQQIAVPRPPLPNTPLPGERQSPPSPPPQNLPPQPEQEAVWHPQQYAIPPSPDGAIGTGQAGPENTTWNGVRPEPSGPDGMSAEGFLYDDPAWQTGSLEMGWGRNPGGGGVACSPLFYLDFFGGASAFDDADAVGLANDGSGATFDFQGGFQFGSRLGLFQGQNLRTDFELALQENDVSISAFAPGQNAPALTSGKLTGYSGVTSICWDFVRFPHRRLKPYLGAGVGFLHADAEFAPRDPGAGQTFLDSDSSLLVQGIAGATWQVNASFDLFAEYRTLDAGRMSLSTERSFVPGSNNPAITQPVSLDLTGDSVVFGLRMKF